MHAHRPTDWQPHGSRRVPWSQDERSGSREGRMLREVTVALPPHIADGDVALASLGVATIEGVTREVVALDHERGAELQVLGAILLRTESVASSKIERVEASTTDYARALHGNRSNAAATPRNDPSGSRHARDRTFGLGASSTIGRVGSGRTGRPATLGESWPTSHA